MKTLTRDQLEANDRIDAWLMGKPYAEYPGQRRPRVPELSTPMVLMTYTPPEADYWEQFFTPLVSARQALSGIRLWDGMTVLEPCAGTGNLIAALYAEADSQGVTFLNILAFEIERKAFDIGAKLFPEVCWVNANALTRFDACGRFDLVLCNPPYGGGNHLKGSGNYKLGKTEYLFLEFACDLLKPGGQAVFIAPKEFISWNGLGYKLDPSIMYQGMQDEPLPVTFLQTGIEVYAHDFKKAGGER